MRLHLKIKKHLFHGFLYFAVQYWHVANQNETLYTPEQLAWKIINITTINYKIGSTGKAQTCYNPVPNNPSVSKHFTSISAVSTIKAR